MAPSSASQDSSGRPISLMLAKYSYATVPMNSIAPVPWIHISNHIGLVAFFETRRSFSQVVEIEEKSIFRVLKDPEIMEELDLHALGREARRALEQSTNAVQHSRDQNVAVITRVPVIAMKYPRNEREVRRFQIRFQSNEDFYEAMKIFSRAGVPTVEAGAFPAQRTQTANSQSSSSSSKSTSWSKSPTRPATAVTPTSMVSAPTVWAQPTTGALSLMPPPPLFPSTDQFALQIPSKKPISLPLQENSAFALYTPRSSSAPNKYSQHLSQLLPPKRDLPFENKGSSEREHLRELRNGKRYSAEPQIRSHGRDDVENAVQLDVLIESQEFPENNKKRRRAPSKAASKPPTPKLIAPKKPRVTKKTTSRAASANPPIPSIVEVLQKCDSQFRTPILAEDTQALLARAAASLKPDTSKSVEPPQNPTTASPANRPGWPRGNVHIEYGNEMHQGTPRAEANGDQSGGHVANIDLGASRCPQAPPTAIDTNTSLLPCAQADQPISTSTPKPPREPHTAKSEAKPVPIPNIQSWSVQFEQTHDLLMQRPGFAGSKERLAAWAGQCKDLRREAIQKFIGDAYQNKGFHELCKELNGDWRPLLIWPEVLRHPNLGRSEDGEME